MERTAPTNQETISALKAMGNRLRIHSIAATSEAGSGHPTTCMSAADLVAAVFFHAMRYDVPNPPNPANDRFVLSKGHAAPLLYAAWAEAGAFPVERLKTLRRIDSELEGHPTPRLPWVEVATGSLGQGLSLGVGMALRSKYLDPVDNRVFVLLGDGECAEGSVWEAAALASYYKLNNLIGILDVNGLGQSQRTMYDRDTSVYKARFEAFGWHCSVIDGHNMREIVTALDEALMDRDRPAMIVAATNKGHGVSFLADKDGWHGKPLKKGEESEKAIAELEARANVGRSLGIKAVTGRSVAASAATTGEAPPSPYEIGESVATREAYGAALARLGEVNPNVVAVDGDTKNSTYSEKFMQKHPDRFFECFIAEQNMVGVAAGLATMGKIPFASTFACFLTRAYDHIRMAAISRANLKLCGSHSGVSIGEDGPSQMGLEDLAMMRAVEGSVVLYPSDATSTEHAVRLAADIDGIVYIRTTRPKLPVLYGPDERFELGGAKVVRSSDNDAITIVGAGVTLQEAIAAHDELKEGGINVRVVDIFSVKPIDGALLRKCGRETGGLILTVEDHYAGGGIGDAVAAAVAPDGMRVHSLAVRDLPRSGPPDALLAAYGIDRAAIVKAVKSFVA